MTQKTAATSLQVESSSITASVALSVQPIQRSWVAHLPPENIKQTEIKDLESAAQNLFNFV